MALQAGAQLDRLETLILGFGVGRQADAASARAGDAAGGGHRGAARNVDGRAGLQVQACSRADRDLAARDRRARLAAIAPLVDQVTGDVDASACRQRDAACKRWRACKSRLRGDRHRGASPADVAAQVDAILTSCRQGQAATPLQSEVGTVLDLQAALGGHGDVARTAGVEPVHGHAAAIWQGRRQRVDPVDRSRGCPRCTHREAANQVAQHAQAQLHGGQAGAGIDTRALTLTLDDVGAHLAVQHHGGSVHHQAATAAALGVARFHLGGVGLALVHVAIAGGVGVLVTRHAHDLHIGAGVVQRVGLAVGAQQARGGHHRLGEGDLATRDVHLAAPLHQHGARGDDVDLATLGHAFASRGLDRVLVALVGGGFDHSGRTAHVVDHLLVEQLAVLQKRVAGQVAIAQQLGLHEVAGHRNRGVCGAGDVDAGAFLHHKACAIGCCAGLVCGLVGYGVVTRRGFGTHVNVGGRRLDAGAEGRHLAFLAHRAFHQDGLTLQLHARLRHLDRATSRHAVVGRDLDAAAAGEHQRARGAGTGGVVADGAGSGQQEDRAVFLHAGGGADGAALANRVGHQRGVAPLGQDGAQVAGLALVAPDLEQEAAQHRLAGVDLGGIDLLFFVRRLQVDRVSSQQGRLPTRGADGAGVLDLAGHQEHAATRRGGDGGAWGHPHVVGRVVEGDRGVFAAEVFPDVNRGGAVVEVGQAQEVLVGDVQGAGHQALHVDLRALTKHHAVGVDEVDGAVGLERSVDLAELGAADDAVQGRRARSGRLDFEGG